MADIGVALVARREVPQMAIYPRVSNEKLGGDFSPNSLYRRGASANNRSFRKPKNLLL